MVVFPSTHSLRESGFKGARIGGQPCDDWVVVGRWATYRRREDINGTIQFEQLVATFGPRRCTELTNGLYRIVAAEDSDDVATLVREQHERYRDDYAIDDTAYWNKLSPEVERAWEEMSLPERAMLVKARRVEPALALSPAIPEEMFSEIAAMIED